MSEVKFEAVRADGLRRDEVLTQLRPGAVLTFRLVDGTAQSSPAPSHEVLGPPQVLLQHLSTRVISWWGNVCTGTGRRPGVADLYRGTRRRER